VCNIPFGNCSVCTAFKYVKPPISLSVGSL